MDPNFGNTDSNDDEDEDDVEDTSDAVQHMDNILSEYYLYNDEYNEMERDVTLSYNTFLPSTLLAMTTNILDNKSGSLYTSIYRSALTKSETRGTTKELELSFGLASGKIVTYNNSTNYGLGILAVSPNSPLESASITRGDIILAVGGVTLNSSNIYGYAQLLMSPTSQATLTLTLESGRKVSVTSEYMYCSPILKSEIYDESVGYLSYLSFDIAYDSDLMITMSEFKEAGITDLILDLRINNGGYVVSANRLATMIGGEATTDRIFSRYTYNPTRMASMSNNLLYDTFYSDMQVYSPNLSRIYCLVGSYTASASEMVINSLRGIGFEVILIGEQTMGKNVGMEVFDFTFSDWYYLFYPVTFAISNEEYFGEYENGFTPDYEVDDWDSGEAFADFSQDEVMVKYALDLISSGSRVQSPQSETRSSQSGVIGGEILTSPRQMGGSILTRE